MTTLSMPSQYTCSPTADEPTHHMVMWDDVGNSIGLVAVSMVGGNYEQNIRGIDVQPANQLSFRQTNSPGTGYSDFERPYSYDEQVTWNNGRGEPYQTATPSTFYDSLNAWTMNANQAVMGPLATYAQGYRSQDLYMPGNVTFKSLLTGGDLGVARKFTAGYSYTTSKVSVIVKRHGTPAQNLTVAIYSDNAGAISASIGSTTITPADVLFDGEISLLYACSIITNPTLVSGTAYWVVVTTTAGTTANCWKIGVNAASDGTTSIYTSVWTNTTTNGPYFRVRDADVLRKWHFFEYRGLLYAATEPESGAGTPQVFRNGWRGVADVNADKTHLLDAAASAADWTTPKLAGGVAQVVAGDGYDDDPNFRVVSTAGAGDAVVSPAWATQHSATLTEYVIRGTNWWTVITAAVSGLTKPIRSVVAPGDVVYYAQGYGTNMYRWGEYNNAGTWTVRTSVADGTNKGDILAVHTDQRDGVQVVLGSNSDKGGGVSVSRANMKTWGDNLQFGTPTPLGQDKYHINGIADGDKYIIVATDSAIYAIDRDTMDKVIDFQAFTGPNNGKAIFFSSPYTYLSMGRGGFERLLNTNMEDIGLWRLDGWPANRQGPIVHGVGHPQYSFVAVDAGASGYSSVYVWNGGWHEIYRSPEMGQRIRSLYYEVIPGSSIDRLWVGMDADIVWLSMPNVLNPVFDSAFRYTYESVITSSWIVDAARDMWKYLKNMKIFAENLSSSTRTIEWDYQTDSETDSSAWHVGTGTFDTSPSTEITVAAKAKRWRYRLRMYTTDSTTSPRIIANTIGLVSGIPPKKMVNITFRVREQDGSGVDLNGGPDGQTYATIVATLKTWESDPSPVHMASVDYDADTLDVMVQPSPRRPLNIIAGESLDIIGTLKLQEA